MLRRRAELSLAAYDVAWERAGLSAKHVALAGPSLGATGEERAVQIDRARRELGDIRLATGTRIDGDLLDALALLANPGQQVFGWFSPDGAAPHAFVAAAAGEDAVVAVTDGAQLALTPIRATALIGSIPHVLPPHPPTRDHSITAPLDAVEAVGRGRTAPGRDGAAARSMVTVLCRPRCGGGQLHTDGPNRPRTGNRADPRVTYVDATEGRTLLTTSTGADGRRWLTAVPGSADQLTERLNRLLRSP